MNDSRYGRTSIWTKDADAAVHRRARRDRHLVHEPLRLPRSRARVDGRQGLRPRLHAVASWPRGLHAPEIVPPEAELGGSLGAPGKTQVHRIARMGRRQRRRHRHRRDHRDRHASSSATLSTSNCRRSARASRAAHRGGRIHQGRRRGLRAGGGRDRRCQRRSLEGARASEPGALRQGGSSRSRSPTAPSSTASSRATPTRNRPACDQPRRAPRQGRLRPPASRGRRGRAARNAGCARRAFARRAGARGGSARHPIKAARARRSEGPRPRRSPKSARTPRATSYGAASSAWAITARIRRR